MNPRRLRIPLLAFVAVLVSSASLKSVEAQTLAAPSGSDRARAGSILPQDRAGVPAAAAARIDAAVTALMARERVPGLSLAVAVDGQVRWERGYGFADLENFVPAVPATVYRLASVSKPITAVAVMQLVEQGLLDLDAPVQRSAPSFPVKPSPVTCRQLLGHLSGIRHYQGEEVQSTREYPSLTAALAIFKDDPLLHPPGAQFTYTTFGYTLLGVAVEGAAGVTFIEYLRRRVFAPAGITTMSADEVSALIPHRSRGYVRDSSGELRNAGLTNTSYKIPGGGLVSTAADLARFGAAVQSGRLVRPETFALMTRPVRTTDGRERPYGYGWIIGEIPNLRPGAVWHGGVQQGTTAIVYLLPKDQVVLAVLANLEGIPSALATFSNDLASIVARGAGR